MKLSVLGCSPSPCESLGSSTNDHDSNVIDTDTNKRILLSSNENCVDNQHHLENNNKYSLNNNHCDTTVTVSDMDIEDEEKERNEKNIKDYLQTFERRSSDSKFMIKDKPNIVEKINLADEIQKLSERLLMLSKMNVEIGGGQTESIPQPNIVTLSPALPNIDLQQPKTNGFSLDLEKSYSTVNDDTADANIDELAERPGLPPNRPDRVLSPITECFNRSISLTPSSSCSLTNGISVINNNSSNTENNNNNHINNNLDNNDSSSVSNESLCSSDRSTVNILDSISKSKSSLKLETPDQLEEQKLSDFSTESKHIRVKPIPNTTNTTRTSFENRILDEHHHLLNHDSFAEDRRAFIQTSRRNSFFAQTINGMNSLNGLSSSTSSTSSSSQLFKSTMSPSLANSTTTSRRTKFRISEQSRDVPMSFQRHHRRGFILENSSATETKDCLLQLLEKYHDNNMRSIRRSSINSGNGMTSLGRHQSLSVDWGLSDSLESRSMNSINAFFHRHSQHGNAVKQIQAQIEARNLH